MKCLQFTNHNTHVTAHSDVNWTLNMKNKRNMHSNGNIKAGEQLSNAITLWNPFKISRTIFLQSQNLLILHIWESRTVSAFILLDNTADHIIKIKNSFTYRILLSQQLKNHYKTKRLLGLPNIVQWVHYDFRHWILNHFICISLPALLHKLCKMSRIPDMKLKSASHLSRSTCIILIFLYSPPVLNMITVSEPMFGALWYLIQMHLQIYIYTEY
jgi:hypothetical protein